VTGTVPETVTRVLLVDDQDLVRNGLRLILGSEPDLEVVGEAVDGVTGRAAVAELDPDVVLLDIRMPGEDGLTALGELVAGECRARIVMLTTFDLDEYVYDALKVGASGFLLKNAPPAQLADGVRAIAAGDLPTVLQLDAAATGEDRRAVFAAMNGTLTGLVVERAGAVCGSAMRSPWGLGPSIVATDREAGVALLSVLRRVPGSPLTVSVPDANAGAVRALRAWGFQTINSATRMRLGPPPAYDPARVFGLFNLFWG
jgi:DNA-binding NarL/FixJ family response regulator